MSTAGATPAVDTGGGPDLNQAPTRTQTPPVPGPSPWDDAVLAAVLMSIDPVGTGGVSLRALAGPVRDQWLAACAIFARGHASAPDSAARLRRPTARRARSGRHVPRRPAGRRAGLLVEADGGVVVLAMAERVDAGTAARLTGLRRRRGGAGARRVGDGTRRGSAVVALDEGVGEDEGAAQRTARPARLPSGTDLYPRPGGGRLSLRRRGHPGARARLASVTIAESRSRRCARLALALGIPRCARPSGAVAAPVRPRRWRAHRVADADSPSPGVWCWPRARPVAADGGAGGAPSRRRPSRTAGSGENQANDSRRPQALEDQVLEAAKAAIPAGLLARLRMGKLRPRGRVRQARPGRAGAHPRAVARRGCAGRAARRDASERGRDPARRRPLAAVCAGRNAIAAVSERPASWCGARTSASPAFANVPHHDLRRRCVGLDRVASPGRSQGCSRTAVVGLLCAPRQRGRARVSWRGCRAAAAADPLAGACQAQPGRPAGRRRHAAGVRSMPRWRWPTRCVAVARRSWCC